LKLVWLQIRESMRPPPPVLLGYIDNIEISILILISGADPGIKQRSGRMASAGARAYNGGLGPVPPACRVRGKAWPPGQGVRGKARWSWKTS